MDKKIDWKMEIKERRVRPTGAEREKRWVRKRERRRKKRSYDNEKHRVRKKLISSTPYRDSNQCPAILLNFRLKWLVKVSFQALKVKETSSNCFRTHDLLLSGHPCTVAPTPPLKNPEINFYFESWHIRASDSWNDDKRDKRSQGAIKAFCSAVVKT